MKKKIFRFQKDSSDKKGSFNCFLEDSFLGTNNDSSLASLQKTLLEVFFKDVVHKKVLFEYTSTHDLSKINPSIFYFF